MIAQVGGIEGSSFSQDVIFKAIGGLATPSIRDRA
jgi:hypothetical protein